MTEAVTSDRTTIPETRLSAPETVTVTSRRVACDGGDASGQGHPRVWLAIPPDIGFVDCGYCDKRFVIDPEQEDHH